MAPCWSRPRRMLRGMTAEVTVKTVEPTPTAVVAAATTWAEFPKMWGPMLDKVWSFLRGEAPEGLYKQGHNIMLYKDNVPSVEVGVQVSGSFEPVGHVVPSALPGGLVATATHTGPIAEIGGTHRAVCEWSTANGYRLARPRWEIYGDPDRRPATSTSTCSGRWWRRNPGQATAVTPLPGDLRDALDRMHSRSGAH